MTRFEEALLYRLEIGLRGRDERHANGTDCRIVCNGCSRFLWSDKVCSKVPASHESSLSRCLFRERLEYKSKRGAAIGLLASRLRYLVCKRNVNGNLEMGEPAL
jgi:hypothetical protein